MLYIGIGLFHVSTYGAHFRPFCITIFYVNRLYGVFRRSAGFYTLKRENAFQGHFCPSGDVPSHCTIFALSYCLYCTTNDCSPSRIAPLFFSQDSGLLQVAEVPLFSPKYNATDTAVILPKTYPPAPLPGLASLPATTRLPVTTRL